MRRKHPIIFSKTRLNWKIAESRNGLVELYISVPQQHVKHYSKHTFYHAGFKTELLKLLFLSKRTRESKESARLATPSPSGKSWIRHCFPYYNISCTRDTITDTFSWSVVCFYLWTVVLACLPLTVFYLNGTEAVNSVTTSSQTPHVSNENRFQT